VSGSGMTHRFASRLSWQMRRQRAARVGPLASVGNAVIGAKRKSDASDLAVAGHWSTTSSGRKREAFGACG
jgi:hypothetical protein